MPSQLDSLRSWRGVRPARLSRELKAPALAVVSGKGGVGKSHVALSLGMAFADQGRRVLLVDGDLGLANLHILCGLHPERDLGDVLEGRCEPEDALLRVEEGLDLLPAASGVAAMANVPRSEIERLGAALAGLQSGYDLVLVDTGAGIGDTTMNMLLASDRALLVSTPEPTAQADAYALLKVARARREDLPLGLCVNLASDAAQASAVASRLGQVAGRFLGRGLPFDGWIPRQNGLENYLIRREPVFRADPQGAFAVAVRTLARDLLSVLPRPNGGFFARLSSMLPDPGTTP